MKKKLELLEFGFTKSSSSLDVQDKAQLQYGLVGVTSVTVLISHQVH